MMKSTSTQNIHSLDLWRILCFSAFFCLLLPLSHYGVAADSIQDVLLEPTVDTSQLESSLDTVQNLCHDASEDYWNIVILGLVESLKASFDSFLPFSDPASDQETMYKIEEYKQQVGSLEKTPIRLRAGLHLNGFHEKVEAVMVACAACKDCSSVGFGTKSYGIGATECSVTDNVQPSSVVVQIYRDPLYTADLGEFSQYRCWLRLRNNENELAAPGRSDNTPDWAWAQDGTPLRESLSGNLPAQ